MATLSYHVYELDPLKKVNRFNSNKRKGVLLRLEDENVGYVDYHPWIELGDPSVDEMFVDLKRQRRSKLADFLIDCAKKDMNRNVDSINWSCFKNHKILTPNTLITSESNNTGVVKVKIGSDIDYEISRLKKIISCNLKVRLDANNGLDFKQVSKIWRTLSDNELGAIEYIEDPTPYDSDSWKKISENIPVALDRWPNSILDQSSTIDLDNDLINDLKQCVDYVVFKPNILSYDYLQKLKLAKPVIFSSYMGHDLGRIHCYFELLEYGDLSLVHGIDTPGIYVDQLELFKPNFKKNTEHYFTPVKENFELLYHNLERLNWSHLCQLT